MNKVTTHIVLFLMFAVFFIGCSSSKSSPVTPQDTQPDIPIGTSMDITDDGNRQLLGVWNLEFDSESLKAIVTPSRLVNTHYQVKYLIPTPEVVINAVHPNYIVDADVTLTNPFTFDAYDVRLILFTDDEDHILDNPDCWTDLYDIPEGLPINPFKAYAKDEPNRVFAGRANHTENLLVFSPPGSHPIQFAVDASVPANCEEPYMFDNYTQTILYDSVGAEAIAAVDVLDWQEDTNEVCLHCPEITGEPLTQFTQINPTKWQLNLTNNTGASVGAYTAYLVAKSSGSGALALYDKVTVTVKHYVSPGWAVSWDDLPIDHCDHIAVDNDGNSYVVGGLVSFSGEVDLDPGPGVDLHTTEQSTRVQTFLCKFDSDSNYLWGCVWTGGVTAFRGGSYRDIAIDDVGSVYVTSRFDYDVDFDPGPGEDWHSSNGRSDAFLSKFDTNGNFQWARTWGGSSSVNTDAGMEVDVDSSGYIYVTGIFQGECDFDPGPDIDLHYGGTISDADLFLCKFDTNGNYQWGLDWVGGYNFWLEGPDWYQNHGISVCPAGFIYVSGWFKDTVDLDPTDGVDEHTSNGRDDIFLSKFHSNGNFIWSRTWGGNKVDQSHGVSTDANGNIYVTGFFSDVVDFDPGPGVEEYSSYDYNTGVFISKFQPDGDFIWARTWGGDESGGVGYDISTKVPGIVYISGSFVGECDFDPGPGEDIHSTGWLQNSDACLSKFDSNGNFIWARSWGEGRLNVGYGVSTDGSGNVFTGGYIAGGADLDPGDGVEIHQHSGAYLIKFHPNGYWE